MTPERLHKIERIARLRQPNFTVLLENVHDPHNIGAVLRSCDAVGIVEIFVLHTDERLQRERQGLGKKSSTGVRKWIAVNYFTDIDLCVQTIRVKYEKLVVSQIGGKAVSLYEYDLTHSVCLTFGNESLGISRELCNRSDGQFFIPQVGFAQSLNISVACAVSLYEAFRQRIQANMYDENVSTQDSDQLLENYIALDQRRMKNRVTRRRNGP